MSITDSLLWSLANDLNIDSTAASWALASRRRKDFTGTSNATRAHGGAKEAIELPARTGSTVHDWAQPHQR
jgi:hypothetical protein